MVEHISQRAGKTPEEIARWHTLHGQVYQKDRETFVEAAYHWECRLRTQLMPFQLISEVKPKMAEYLLEPYLPKGMLTVLGGVSGVGKTWLALYWAAQVSRSFPTDEEGAVYYFTQENDPAIVLRPRLEALDAETELIIVQRFDDTSASLMLNGERLESAANTLPPKLVLFDPIQSYLGVDMNKANEVRPILDWLGRFAQRHQCAVVLVSNMAKLGVSNTDALDRLRLVPAISATRRAASSLWAATRMSWRCGFLPTRKIPSASQRHYKSRRQSRQTARRQPCRRGFACVIAAPRVDDCRRGTVDVRGEGVSVAEREVCRQATPFKALAGRRRPFTQRLVAAARYTPKLHKS